MIRLLTFFLAVLGAVISHKKIHLAISQELALVLSCPPNITYLRQKRVWFCYNLYVPVSEIMKMVIHYGVSPNALFQVNLFLVNRSSCDKPLKYLLHFAF